MATPPETDHGEDGPNHGEDSDSDECLLSNVLSLPPVSDDTMAKFLNAQHVGGAALEKEQEEEEERGAIANTVHVQCRQ